MEQLCNMFFNLLSCINKHSSLLQTNIKFLLHFFPDIGEWEPEPTGDSGARVWCPDLLQEGQWHHLAFVLNRAVLKNSSFSLYVDGQHVHTQKVGIPLWCKHVPVMSLVLSYSCCVYCVCSYTTYPRILVEELPTLLLHHLYMVSLGHPLLGVAIHDLLGSKDLVTW